MVIACCYGGGTERKERHRAHHHRGGCPVEAVRMMAGPRPSYHELGGTEPPKVPTCSECGWTYDNHQQECSVGLRLYRETHPGKGNRKKKRTKEDG